MDPLKQRLIVHPRIQRRHPEVTEEDVRTAWENLIRIQQRENTADEQYFAIGIDGTGRALELTATRTEEGETLIFHAMKATQKACKELGLTNRRRPW